MSKPTLDPHPSPASLLHRLLSSACRVLFVAALLTVTASPSRAELTLSSSETPATTIGVLPDASLAFDGLGTASPFDTEIALYPENGMLLGVGDNGDASLLSSLNDGTYLSVVGGFNSIFFTEFAAVGTEAGPYNFGINGVNGVALVPIPEPTTALFGVALIALCAAARRRTQA